MVFSSLVFLCVFLPVTYVLYLLAPSLKAKNALLIVVSLLFYAYGEPIFLPMLVLSVVLNWLLGRGLSRTPLTDVARRKLLLVLGVVGNLLFLGVFKYAGMAVDTINGILGTQFEGPAIWLPMGISFFTFQALSYVIDVYRGEAPGDDDVWKVLLYISFFPQIIAGPIVKYHDIEQQIDHRSLDVHESALGMRRFIFGLSKKVLIANSMGLVADTLFGIEPGLLNAPSAWLGAIAYLMQIYFDFSAYSDMAIGLGHLFGFTILENFDHPYASVTIKEFWRRWHISLSTWFKEYLYIPLGGNRRGKLRTGLNKVIVFFLCGLWHGASWTFVVWGLIHGFFSLLEEVVPIKRLPRVLGHIYTLLVVMLAFVFFRADSIDLAFQYLARMVCGWDLSHDAMVTFASMLTPEFLLSLGAAVVTCVPPRFSATFEAKYRYVSFALSFVFLALCILELSAGTYNPFIYFRF